MHEETPGSSPQSEQQKNRPPPYYSLSFFPPSPQHSPAASTATSAFSSDMEERGIRGLRYSSSSGKEDHEANLRRVKQRLEPLQNSLMAEAMSPIPPLLTILILQLLETNPPPPIKPQSIHNVPGYAAQCCHHYYLLPPPLAYSCAAAL